MKKSVIFFLTIFISFTSPQVEKSPDFNVITEAFKDSNIEFKEASLNGWAKLKEDCSQEELESLVHSIFELMMAEPLDKNITYDGVNSKTIYKGNSSDGVVIITIDDIYNVLSKKSEYVIMVDATQKSNTLNMNIIGEGLKKNLCSYGSGPPINLCITGCIEGNVEESIRLEVINGLFASAKGKVIESINNDNFISVCGYTKSISNFIKSNNEKINLNSYNATIIKIGNQHLKTEENTIIYIDKANKLDLNSIIYIKGDVTDTNLGKNFLLFNYENYLRTKKIHATIFCSSNPIIIQSNYSLFIKIINNFKLYTENTFNSNLNKNNSQIILSMILGDSDYLDD